MYVDIHPRTALVISHLVTWNYFQKDNQMIYQDWIWIHWKINIISCVPSISIVVFCLLKRKEKLNAVSFWRLTNSAMLPFKFHTNNLKPLKVSSSATTCCFLVVHLKEAVNEDSVVSSTFSVIWLRLAASCLSVCQTEARERNRLSHISGLDLWVWLLIALCTVWYKSTGCATFTSLLKKETEAELICRNVGFIFFFCKCRFRLFLFPNITWFIFPCFDCDRYTTAVAGPV